MRWHLVPDDLDQHRDPPTTVLTAYRVQAAMHVAALIDQPGSAISDARESYWHRATGGRFSHKDLQAGEQLLLDVGLVVKRDGRLYPTRELDGMLEQTVEDVAAAFATRVLAAGAPGDLAALVPDATRREELMLALGRTFDDEARRLLGMIGEETVVAAARAQLLDLGYPDLARAVRHVSLETDQAGYDVSAPRIAGPARLIEVKATGAVSEDGLVRVYLSRNEAETGQRFANWSLVLCEVASREARDGEILGWCGAELLTDCLPSDSASGRWESASFVLAVTDLLPGLPPVV